MEQVGATTLSAAPRLERSEGELRLAFKTTGERTSLDTLYQSGCLKARLPRSFGSAPREAVLINTAGGLTDGDRLTMDVGWGAGSRAVVASQAAERLYRCRAAPAVIRTVLSAGEGSVAAWLPQETIVFDGACLERETCVTLSAGSRFFGSESLVFGRAAMGETVMTGRLFDRWQVVRRGRAVFIDALSLGDTEGVADTLGRPGIAGGARSLATIVYSDDTNAAPSAHDAVVERWRQIGGDCGPGLRTGVSDLDDVVVSRVIADDSRIMRHFILSCYVACLEASGFTEPRVWHC